MYSTENIRNIALIGHSGEGKTSLAEAMLYYCKSIDRLGKVDDGTSSMDYDTEEVNRKISISLAVAFANFKDTKINIIDVPGFFDFEGEMVAALSAADGAIIVTSASGSLTVGTEKALDLCLENKIPAMIFINGVDKENSDFFSTVHAIEAKYTGKVAPIEFPIMEGSKMVGYVNCLTGVAYKDGSETAVPSKLESELGEAVGALTELAAEADDEFLMKYLEGESLTHEELIRGVKIRAMHGDIVPVIAGSATAMYGIENLLSRIVDLIPSPIEARTRTTEDGKTISCDPTAPFSAQIFKSICDQYGKQLLFKVMTGKVSIGDTVLNTTKDESEKIGSSLGFPTAKGKKVDTDTVIAGDIGSISKLTYTAIGDSLSDPNNPVKFAPIAFPNPVIAFAVSSADKNVEEKVIAGFTKLLEEDATFKLEKNVETNEMLLSGLGEMQLDILCKKIKNKFNVEAVLKEPKISYRETIRKKVEAEGKHKKQSGGAGQFGQCTVRFEPGAEDGVFEFVDEVVGGVIPRQFIPAVEKGLREAVKHGILAGYPMVNLKATVFDGKYHPVDSKEIAFINAAKIAYAEGLQKASPVFLEPIMTVKVIVPESYMGDVLGDLNKRRGRILGMESEKGKSVVNAEVPQGEMSRYATDLRSMTQGRGRFEMAFDRYEEVPQMISEKIIKDAAERNKE